MSDAVSLLRERVEKAEAKVHRAEKSLESARAELADFKTALRVMEDLTGESVPSLAASGGAIEVSTRQARILALLTHMGQAPADLFAAYKDACGEDINIDTFRTSIWRMKGRAFAESGVTVWVKGDSGLYWKEADGPVKDGRSNPLASESTQNESEPNGEIAVGSVAGEREDSTLPQPWINPQSVRRG